jgi:hypothetical protein
MLVAVIVWVAVMVLLSAFPKLYPLLVSVMVAPLPPYVTVDGPEEVDE